MSCPLQNLMRRRGRGRSARAKCNHSGQAGNHLFAWNPRRTAKGVYMIRKLKSGQYRLYSRKKDEATGKRRNLGTFSTVEQAEQHEREVQYFKKH